jgi:hypothetical protein
LSTLRAACHAARRGLLATTRSTHILFVIPCIVFVFTHVVAFAFAIAIAIIIIIIIVAIIVAVIRAGPVCRALHLRLVAFISVATSAGSRQVGEFDGPPPPVATAVEPPAVGRLLNS